MMSSRRFSLSLFVLETIVIICLAATANRVYGAASRAAIPDEVLRRFKPDQGTRPARNPIPDELHTHLEHALDILEGIEAEDRGEIRGVSNKLGLLGNKIVDISRFQGSIGALINELEVAAKSLPTPLTRGASNELAARIQKRFQEVNSLLSDVVLSQNRGSRRAAINRAKAELRSLVRKAKPEQAGEGPISTVTPGQPTTQEPLPNNAPAPVYHSFLWDDAPVRYAFLGPLLLMGAAAPSTPPEAVSCSYNAADLAPNPDVQLTQEIRDLAESLSFSPVRIFQYVTDQIKFEPYYGSLKGAVGTLHSKAGNATDHASLLVALLRASNIPARYVKGVAHFKTDARFQRWIGGKTTKGAVYIASRGRIPTAYDQTSDIAQITHVWVEACVPYGNYRGTAVDQSGHRWIPLDASFKDKTYQAGIATNVPFDFAGFLAKRTAELPHEKYAQQVEEYIKSQPPNFANNVLEDVPYIGTNVPRQIDLLPASLPYQVIAFNSWDGTAGGAAETATLPDTHRYKFSITVRNGSDVVVLPTRTFSFVDIILKRVTLSFRGATAADQTNVNSLITANSVTPVPCSPAVNVVPVLKVEGVEDAAGSAVQFCTINNKLNLQITLADFGTSPVNNVNFSNIQASDYHALQGYSFQTSDRLLNERSAKLLASVRTTVDPNANQDEIEGEFLHLVGLKYMRHLADSLRYIGQLDGGSGESGNHLGLVSSRMKVEYILDLPFAVSRTGFLVDMPGIIVGNGDLTTGNFIWKTFQLSGYSASAYESYIWQEAAHLDAVSTVRGIQYANETGITLLTITNANQGTEVPKLCTAITPCAGGSSTLYHSSSTVSQMQSLASQNFTITIPRSQIQYSSWRGAVYVAEKSDGVSTADCPGGICGRYIIGGGYSGGYVVEDFSPENYVPIIPYTPPLPDFSDLDAPYIDPNDGLRHAAPAENLAAGTFEPTPVDVNAGIGLGITKVTTTHADPVNMVNGNMYHTERDLVIKGRGGLPFVFERSYNSRSGKDGPLGFGWTHSFNHKLAFDDDNYNFEIDPADKDNITSSLVWIDGTGSRKFIAIAGANSAGVPTTATFTAPEGFYFTVSREAGTNNFVIREKNGLTYTFETIAGTINQTAKLLSIKDRNNNVLTLNYSGSFLTAVTDGLGRSLTFTPNGNNRIAQVCDWTGRCHQYLYDANGNLVTYKNPLTVAGSQAPVTYDYYSAPGKPIDHAMKFYKLPRGNGMFFEYYVHAKALRHCQFSSTVPTSCEGQPQTTSFTYNEFRRESVSVNERGYQRQFFFDKNGMPIKIVEERGGARLYAYDPAKPFNRISKRDPIGYVTQYVYDANGNVITVTNPSASTVQYFNFNSFNQPGKAKDARGNYTIFKYDAKGNMLQQISFKSGFGAAVDPAAYTPVAADIVAWTIKTYDTFGSLLTTKRVRDFATQVGPTVEFTYDAQGLNATTITRRGDKNGDGSISASEFDSQTLTYDSLGRATTGIRPDWYVTQSAYDAVDRVIQGTDQLGNLRTFSYDANGNPSSQSLNIGGFADLMTYAYDLSDRRVESTDAGGFTTSQAYDAAGNVIQIVDPDGFSLAFQYDPNNKLIAALDEEGRRVSKQLDLDGKPRSITDPNGNTMSYEYYDSAKDGRLKKQIDPLGRSTQFDYDAHGNVTVVTDNLVRTTLTTYDELNRPTRIVKPAYADTVLGQVRPVTKSSYDNLGRLIQVAAGHTDSTGTNPANDSVTTQMTYQYDDFGRKIREVDALGRVWTAQWDINGNPIAVSNPKGQVTQMTYGYGHQLLTRNASGNLTTYTRNPLGQVTQVQSPNVTYTLGYDGAHRLSNIHDSRGNKQISYTYSAAGRRQAMQDSDGNRTDYEYDPVGRLTGIWAPNNDYTAFAYDDGGRLKEKWFPNGVNTQYSYNADNTLQQVINRHGSGTIISQHDYTYDGVGNRATHNELIGGATTPYKYVYDELTRLTEVRNNTTDNLLEGYAYDPLGNRRTKTSGGTTLAYFYDDANQLREIHTGSAGGPLSASLLYDNNGNLQKKCEGGTITVSPTSCAGNTVTDLTHDSLNRLTQVAKTGISTEMYKYDDGGRRIQKTVGGIATNFLYDGSNIINQFDNNWALPAAIYTHGPGMDAPIMRVAGGAAQYYHQDGLGSVVGMTNASGATVGTARYDAYGIKLASTGSVPQFGYTGREPDETGLVYYRARFYDPSIGRFTQRDPIGFNGGMNLYAYVNGNPINFNDPMGLVANDPGNPIKLAAVSGDYTGSMNDTGGGGITAAQQSMARIAPVPGYSEEGQFSWRGSLDQTVINAVSDFNREYLLEPGDAGYRTPEFVKAWMMIETGGNKSEFLRDPLQMNADPRDWSDRKLDIGVPRNRSEMTPEISISAGLEWLNMKGYQSSSGNPVYPYQGDLSALRRYNGSPTVHDNPNTARVPHDYHRGITHSRWYAVKIIGLELRMSGYE